MRSKCEYCGNYIESTEENCPNCGAVNPNHQRNAAGVPQTMEELKAFCSRHSLPLEEMRFFIGVDYKKPKAFGIYQDRDGNFVVYKNKSDGSRAIRYKGTDEAYAVHELYLKLQSEVQKQKKQISSAGSASEAGQARQAAYSSTPYNQDRRMNRFAIAWGRLSSREKRRLIGSLLLVLFFGSILAFNAMVPDKGYYSYEGSYYYYDYHDWYRFDREQLDWIPADMANSPLDRHYNRYLINNNGSDSHYSESVDSEYYEAFSSSQGIWGEDSPAREYCSDSIGDNSDWDSDWDSSDWDWDSGDDWYSSYTDWDSDW